MEKHFCTCPVSKCPKHPGNHSDGCDPCMQSNLQQKKVPSCLFLAVNKDISGVTDYTIKGFVDFFLAHDSEQTENG